MLVPPVPHTREATWGRPARPGLAAVLGALTNVPEAEWSHYTNAGAPPVDIELPHERELDLGITLRTQGGLGRSATLTCPGPQEAWELLATRGLIPECWVDDPARVFAYFAGLRADHTDWVRVDMPWPRTLRTLVAVAADVAAMVQVEALARECLARLARWGGLPPPARVRWVLPDREQFGSLESWHEGLAVPAGCLLERLPRDPPGLLARVPSGLWTEVRRNAAWPADRPDNPFEPYLELCRLGYLWLGPTPGVLELLVPPWPGLPERTPLWAVRTEGVPSDPEERP